MILSNEEVAFLHFFDKSLDKSQLVLYNYIIG